MKRRRLRRLRRFIDGWILLQLGMKEAIPMGNDTRIAVNVAKPPHCRRRGKSRVRGRDLRSSWPIRGIERRVELIELQLEATAEQLPAVDRLKSIPGMGLPTATALVAFRRYVCSPPRFTQSRTERSRSSCRRPSSLRPVRRRTRTRGSSTG